ncbi:dynamin family protein [Albidovulum sediminicola]|uniref:Dynamin N-terminal domain-containing protein n=1 Tax=Albidovulum sediminicola TaxID=2984331 RepID=A0ABT2Z536_9RHOB|nr:dynamin family protein [Defluviimonas sp. WL0075]MCV2866269.1 hypothetical protein [Defluviimonas sp. WL0075]
MNDGQTTNQRPVSPAGMTRLESWASRKPCIALMGEFSAGKTTLTNLLVGEDVLPTRVTATQLPPVWMSYGDPAAWYVDTEGHRHDIGFEELHTVPVEGVRYIRIFCKGRILETIDLIDTPGISDPNIPKTVWEMAVGYVNAVLWCTHSTQAWRESERSAWESLPERLRENSILLATRSDKLLAGDRQRVARRLKREAGDMFRSIIMFSAMDAIRAVSEEDASGLWVESGGDELLSALHEISHDIIEARMGMLSRYAVITGENVQPSRVRPGRAVRPARAERDDGAPRERLSRDDAATMRSFVVDSGDRPAAATGEASEVLHLDFSFRTGVAEPETETVEPMAEDQVEESAETPAAQTPTADAAGAEVGDPVERKAEADVSEAEALPSDVVAELAPEDTENVPLSEVAEWDVNPVQAGEDTEPEVLQTSLTRLWRDLLASEPEAHTVRDVLALFEKFLTAVDRAEGVEPDEEDAGIRRHG